jgi:hypothetical protein
MEASVRTFHQPHQQRVVDEQIELGERMKKLSGFFDTPTYRALDDQEKNRLERQLSVMLTYWTILEERITAFTP